MCFAAVGLALGATEATAAMMGFSAISSVAGLGLQAYSSMQQSQAAKDSADYNAAVQRNNAMAREIRERMTKAAEGRQALNLYDTKDNAARLAKATGRDA